jgi:hypothetical protein
MLDAVLVPEKTVVTAKGDSAPQELTTAANAVFLVTLSIMQVVEQESLELSLFTSADGATWDAKPVAALPQKFYPGEYPLLVNLSGMEKANFLRAHWEVTRWGRGSLTPKFEFGVRIREVSPQDLLEARAEAQSYR